MIQIPSISTIIYAATKLAEQIPTFQGAGFRFYRDRKLQSYQKPKKEKYTVEDVVKEVLKQRMRSGGGLIAMPLDEWTQDSVWYNALSIFEKWNVNLPTRKHLKSLIRGVCRKLGVTREQIGIVAAPWATMYYRGQWYIR